MLKFDKDVFKGSFQSRGGMLKTSRGLFFYLYQSVYPLLLSAATETPSFPIYYVESTGLFIITEAVVTVLFSWELP